MKTYIIKVNGKVYEVEVEKKEEEPKMEVEETKEEQMEEEERSARTHHRPAPCETLR